MPNSFKKQFYIYWSSKQNRISIIKDTKFIYQLVFGTVITLMMDLKCMVVYGGSSRLLKFLYKSVRV
ncbi:hypothetical protein RhiirB3_429672 [Rhizophagus irregularis]|nr:hypothetical protein RhiirB3_429672 [Rhizophagus irregularis]